MSQRKILIISFVLEPLHLETFEDIKAEMKDEFENFFPISDIQIREGHRCLNGHVRITENCGENNVHNGAELAGHPLAVMAKGFIMASLTRQIQSKQGSREPEIGLIFPQSRLTVGGKLSEVKT